MFVLVIKSGPLAGRRVEPGSELTIGRAANDLSVDDPAISRRHAVFRLVGDALEVEDLGSRNGTLVNGERIAATRPGTAASACKKACDACAVACESGDERMKKCAAVCKECAKACEGVGR